ncbi:MAG TPA: PAS domain-containing sensor histidine kinase [Deltaproteobacteria bacterium]|nr:PAS domain-containing sensor histidine kinase [Deltaproteobacteria bacterium]
MPVDLQRVLDAVLDGVLVVDREGRVEHVNAEACRILETSPEAIGGEPIEGVLGPDHAMAKLARAALSSGRTALASDQAVERRHEVKLVVDVAASATFDERGTPDGVVLALRDRTIQHSLQRVVTERERLAAFGRIAAGIAHEVKNPLGGIRGAAELLELRATDSQTRESARLIVREVDRIATLVDDLMVFARGEKLQLAPVNLHRLLDDVLDLLAHDPLSASARVERHFDPSLPELLADPDRLVQVFLNLARNALQALEAKGGTLLIRTRVSVDHRLLTEDGARVPEVLVEFEDTGPGIPADVLENVSTPFFTTRARGTGLGLALSKHWVARHGGVLRVESVPGKGTTVRVSLPLRRTE